jgi:spermidine synthase
LASSLNVLAGLLLFAFLAPLVVQIGDRPRDRADESRKPVAGQGPTIVNFFFFLSGFAALLLEVVWIRHVGLIYGSGLHAFAIVVVTFLLGLSLGSAFYETVLKRVRNQIVLFSAIELGIAATALLVSAAFPHMELVFLQVYFGTESYPVFVILLSLVCFAVLLLPSMLMGMTLPALCTIAASEVRIGNDFGKLYAINSVGALLGSFCAGFIIIPALGIYHSPFVAAGIYIFIAFGFLFCFTETRRLRRRAAVAFVVILLTTAAVFKLVNKPDHLYAGVFYSGIGYSDDRYREFLDEPAKIWPIIRFLKTGIYGQVAAYGTGGNMNLNSNGRIDSSTHGNTRSYQLMLGHIPMLIHPRPSAALIIGLGAGWTINAAVQHNETESVDCVEINPLIVEANRAVFHAYNGDILNNPKVTTYVNDGRNYVAHTNKQYQVIISEPPEFWFSGVSALFTTQFYKQAKRVLAPDGLFCQWFPRYEIAETDYKIALNTMRRIFPFTYEFDMARITGDEYYQSFLVVAAKEAIDVPARLDELQVRYGTDGSQYGTSMVQLVGIARGAYSRTDEELEAYVADVDTLHTDDFPIIEFHAARDRFRKFRNE